MNVTRKVRSAGARGFTVVELMVVMLLVALLSTIAFHGVARFKQSADRAKCASNLRQLGAAVALYTGENHGEFPRYLEATPEGRRWYFGLEPRGGPNAEGQRRLIPEGGPLWPYIESVGGVEVCPAFDYQSSGWKAKFEGASWGYGYNWLLGGRFGGSPMAVHRIRNPAQAILFADCAQVNTFQAPASPDNPMLEEFYIVNETYPTIHFRHNGLANILFVDGHVEAHRVLPGTEDRRIKTETVGRITPYGSTDYLR